MIRCLVFLMISTLTGCVMVDVEHDDVSSSTQAMNTSNSLSMNSLSMNSLSMNSLSMNSLDPDATVVGALTLNTSASNGLEYDSEGRRVLAYSAKCALRDGDYLVAEIDGVTHVFPGLLGIAPRWAARRLTRPERHAVSACLLAHVNAFGISVELSLRGADIDVSATEQDEYLVHEAAYFGDVFEEKPQMYVCWQAPHDQAVASTDARSVRVCADRIDPDQPAGMCTSDPDNPFIVTGPCSETCMRHTSGIGWDHCWSDSGQFYRDAINVWLSHDSNIIVPDDPTDVSK